MGKEVKLNFNHQEQIDKLVDAVKANKRKFIAPKAKMKQSIDNDAQYLVALGEFIQNAQQEMERLSKRGETYQASKIKVELFEAIGKYQANEGLVNDKSLHFEKVFLPMYEKELEESRAQFDGMLNQSKELLSNMLVSKESIIDTELGKILSFLEKEVDNYEACDDKDDEEYKNYMYKIFKRLYNKAIEIAQAQANASSN